MIFGRNKNQDTPPPAETTPGAPDQPVTPATPAVPAPAISKAPQAPAAPSASTSAPGAAPENQQRSQRILASKLVSASFGEIVAILMRSDTYKHFTLSDLEWLVIPPVLTQQFVLAEARKQENDIPSPIAVALWASVSEEVDQKLSANLTSPLKLRPDEWKSGDILWLIDAVGPTQILNGLVANLHAKVFKGRPVKVRARDKQGKPFIKVHQMPVEGEGAAP